MSRLVFASGCFDVIHAGHVFLLRQARSFGDHLVVGLDTDESIRRTKGVERPLNTFEDRRDVLLEMRSVNEVVPFEGLSGLLQLLRTIRPGVIVKGNDYDLETTPEFQVVREWGCQICLVPKCSLSSSLLIQRSLS